MESVGKLECSTLELSYSITNNFILNSKDINNTLMTKKLHYFSGLVLSVFVGFHLFNHFWSIFGAEAHIEMMDSFRLVYRNLIIESLLLLAVIIQIFSGIKLLVFKNVLSSFFDQLHHWSGIYLAFFLLIHVSAVIIGRLFLKLDTNFYFGVAGLNTFPFYFFFVPYYLLAIFSFFAHIAAIHRKKMKYHLLGFSPEKQSFLILTFALIYLGCTFWGLTNHFDGVSIPTIFKLNF